MAEELDAIRARRAAIGNIRLKCEESGAYPGSYSLVETGDDWNNDAWADPDGYFSDAALPTFLAAAPADIDTLLAEVARLQAELTRETARADRNEGHGRDLKHETGKLRAEITRLHSDLQAVRANATGAELD